VFASSAPTAVAFVKSAAATALTGRHVAGSIREDAKHVVLYGYSDVVA
jgi:hypothetical protein